jgi:hypothetical protein
MSFLAEGSTGCMAGTSVAATETFMKSRGMSDLPPEAAVRNRALPPAPATTFECLVLILDQV